MFSFLSAVTVTVSSHSNRNLKTPFLFQVVFSHDALFIMATETKTKTWGFLVQYSSYSPEKVSFTELEAELMTNKLQWFSCLHTHQSTGVITPPPGLFIYLIYLCRDQRSPCKNQFCPSIMWVQVWTQVFMLCNTHPYLLSRLPAPGMAFHMNELGSSCLHSKCSHPLSHLPNLPLLEPIIFEDKNLTFPWRHSIKWPMVIREGMAWGFMMISGVMPSQVKGISYKENVKRLRDTGISQT